MKHLGFGLACASLGGVLAMAAMQPDWSPIAIVALVAGAAGLAVSLLLDRLTPKS